MHDEMFSKAKRYIWTLMPLLAAIPFPGASAAYSGAFPVEAQPSFGAILHIAPKLVRIRFDSRLEEEFSIILVKDAAGERISGKTKIDTKSLKILEVDLPSLTPGDYHVYWSVNSWDGQRTKGDYVFHFLAE